MLAEKRRSRLLELVRASRFASLPELAERLHVSESTIRRDVEQLEEQGTAKRIHGGVLYAGSSPKLTHFEIQDATRWAQKKAIAELAVELIEPGDTLLLDGGSTTHEIARRLVGQRLHVVTNSLPVANLFASDPNCDLIMIGGSVSSRLGVVMGPAADKMIATLRVGKTIFSVAGITEEGFFNNDLLLVETEKAMMRTANEVIVVADSSKIGRQSLTHLCKLGDVHSFVVDDGISDGWKEKISSAGVKLLVAKPNEDKEQIFES